MPKQESIERWRTVKRLRDAGRAWKECGAAVGVSVDRARQMYDKLERHERRAEYERNNPQPAPWYDGLSNRARKCIDRLGFSLFRVVWDSGLPKKIGSRDDLAALITNDEPVFFRGKVATEAWKEAKREGYPLIGDLLLNLDVANEILRWLGKGEIAAPARVVKQAELDRARALLERHGYTVKAPGEQPG